MINNNNIRYPLWLNTVGLCAIAGHGCPKTEDHCPTCSAPDDGDRNQFRQGPRELDSLPLVFGSERFLRCANPACVFFIHVNFHLGGFCCRTCHQCYEEHAATSDHGGSFRCHCCEIIAPPERFMVALPMAPLEPLVPPVRAYPFVPSGSVEPIRAAPIGTGRWQRRHRIRAGFP